ncbi:MAG: diguanylate cyclase [Thiohalomonadales bacterium]
MPFNKNQATILLLVGTIAAVTGGVAISMLWMLYQATFKNYSERLQEITRTQTEIVNALVSYNKRLYINRDDAFATTMEILREANEAFSGIGETGEFTLAAWSEDEITYYISQRTPGTPSRDQSLFKSNLSQPMRRALSGHSGVMIAEDYKGVKVLAAFEPVRHFDLGVVAKIEISEIRAPFIKAGIISTFSGLILIFFGSVTYSRFYRRLRSKENLLQDQYDRILDNTLDGIVTIDKLGIIQSINHAAAKLFGYRKSELMGNNISILMPESMRNVHDTYLAHANVSHNNAIVGTLREVDGQKKDGSIFPMDISLNKMEHDNNIYYTGIMRDISERIRIMKAMEEYKEHLEDQVEKRTTALSDANKQLEKLANIDGLTGIANRRVFDKVLKREINRAIRESSSISLILCDIDFFKNYNDTYGHLAGDECLTKIATTIHDLFQRASDVVARYGGEEFAVILPGVEYENLSQLANQIKDATWALKVNHLSPDGTDRISISVGGASVIPKQGFEVTTLIKIADESLYRAKQNGRNGIVVFNIDTEQESYH